LSAELSIPLRTLQRWREWWVEQFRRTALWQADCAHFMPPAVDTALFPGCLLERFAGDAAEALLRLLVLLSPLTVRPVTLNEGR
jgi:hypothetical protein